MSNMNRDETDDWLSKYLSLSLSLIPTEAKKKKKEKKRILFWKFAIPEELEHSIPSGLAIR